MLVAALLVATTHLGFWQLRRLDARQDYNARVVARADEPVVTLATAFGALTEGRPPEDLRHVRVTVSGTWDVASEVYLANRSRDGVPGVHVVTLLRIEGARPSVGVAVDRGFVPRVHYLKGDRSAWAPSIRSRVTTWTPGTPSRELSLIHISEPTDQRGSRMPSSA